MYEKILSDLCDHACMDMDADLSSEIRSFADELRKRERGCESSVVDAALEGLYDGDRDSLKRDLRSRQTAGGTGFSHAQRKQVLQAVYRPLSEIYGTNPSRALYADMDGTDLQTEYEKLLSDFVEDVRTNADEADSEIQNTLERILRIRQGREEQVIRTLLQNLCGEDRSLSAHLVKMDLIGMDPYFEKMKVEPAQRPELLPCLCEALGPYMGLYI